MLEGQEIEAIFGFCYIHHFAEINEVLQEQTMIFVNEISEIVHSSIDKFNGNVNKNLGDCFLVAWKINKKSYEKDRDKILELIEDDSKKSNEQNQFLYNKNCRNYYSDCAVTAYLTILKKIYKSKTILKYRKDERLIKKLGPNFKIEMGMGVRLIYNI